MKAKDTYCIYDYLTKKVTHYKISANDVFNLLQIDNPSSYVKSQTWIQDRYLIFDLTSINRGTFRLPSIVKNIEEQLFLTAIEAQTDDIYVINKDTGKVDYVGKNYNDICDYMDIKRGTLAARISKSLIRNQGVCRSRDYEKYYKKFYN